MPDLTRQIAITGHVAVPIVHDAGPNLHKNHQMFSVFLLTCWSKGLNVEMFGLGGSSITVN
mgnify:FL=1